MDQATSNDPNPDFIVSFAAQRVMSLATLVKQAENQKIPVEQWPRIPELQGVLAEMIWVGIANQAKVLTADMVCNQARAIFNKLALENPRVKINMVKVEQHITTIRQFYEDCVLWYENDVRRVNELRDKPANDEAAPSIILKP